MVTSHSCKRSGQRNRLRSKRRTINYLKTTSCIVMKRRILSSKGRCKRFPNNAYTWTLPWIGEEEETPTSHAHAQTILPHDAQLHTTGHRYRQLHKNIIVAEYVLCAVQTNLDTVVSRPTRQHVPMLSVPAKRQHRISMAPGLDRTLSCPILPPKRRVNHVIFHLSYTMIVFHRLSDKSPKTIVSFL